MSEIVVFHSALGLRPAVARFADRLRDRGYTVHTPDLFDGKAFNDLDAAVAHRDTVGIPQLIERAHNAVADLPESLVYIGFSMGTGPAQLLAATRPVARGAVLIQGALEVEMLGLESWPADVPIQLHVAVDDPWFDRDSAEKVRNDIPHELLDHHEYPTSAHLFADPDWHEYDATATAQLLEAVTTWLDEHAPPTGTG